MEQSPRARRVRRRVAAVMVSGLVAAPVAGCGDSDPTVEVLSPPPGTVVRLPFEVTLDASVPLGASDEDLYHVHIWFGDDLDSYLVVESTVVEVTTAPAGQQEMHVSLRNPDHTDAGAATSVTLVIDGSPAG